MCHHHLFEAHGGSLGEEYSEVLLVDASRHPATRLQRLSCAALQAVTTTGRVGRVEWVTMALRLYLAQLGGETNMLEWKTRSNSEADFWI